METVSRQDLVLGNTYYLDGNKNVTGVFAGRDETSIYFRTQDPGGYALSMIEGYEDCVVFWNDFDGSGFVPCG